MKSNELYKFIKCYNLYVLICWSFGNTVAFLGTTVRHYMSLRWTVCHRHEKVGMTCHLSSSTRLILSWCVSLLRSTGPFCSWIYISYHFYESTQRYSM